MCLQHEPVPFAASWLPCRVPSWCFCRDVGEEDVLQLKAIVQGLAQAEGLSPSVRGAGDGGGLDSVWNSLVAECCRWGGSEIHCVGAVMGGIASQEAIKVSHCGHPSGGGTLLCCGPGYWLEAWKPGRRVLWIMMSIMLIV